MKDARATAVRRLLIVDDQQPIHDTFARIFDTPRNEDETLAQFEARFLDLDEPVAGRRESQKRAAPAYELVHATTGRRAVELMSQAVRDARRFSVAFVDMRMPQGLDGIATTRKLWQIDEDLQIVICTAHSDHAWHEVLEQLGYSDRLLLLKKPFESDEVRQLALALSEKSRLSAIRNKQINDLQSEVLLRRGVEDELREMALHDTLTKLPNRCFLLDRLQQIIAKRRRHPERRDAVLFLDLDNFKIINDSLGHDAGDDLLNEVAVRLKECVREHDLTARGESQQRFCEAGQETIRLGGDEFVVVLECLLDDRDAIVVADRIVKRLAQPFQLGERLVNVGTSVGVAYVHDQLKDGNEALRNADTAMYRAKTSGKGRVAVFDQTMHEAVCERLDLEAQLRQALETGGFSLRYQPIVDLSRARIAGVEALLRWQDATGREVPPTTFVPIMEEVGLITDLGEWVIEQASQAFGDMMRQLPASIRDEVYLGVNLSSRQLNDQHFLMRLKEILDRTGFDRHRFKLEICESQDQRNDSRSLACMQSLQELGVGLHIDDFGKGRSSLLCFQSYPVETIKIDRSFTAEIAGENSHAVITKAIIQLAHHLGAGIVAEGVESEEQLNLLRRWECNLAQGYLFSPPLTLDELRELLLDPKRSRGVRLLTRPLCGLMVDAPTSDAALTLS